MPDEPDERLVPPLKVMRRRLNGVYRADSGFSGPTRRYVLIVALLVGLASIPTLAAITAGSNELSDGKTDTMDVPFLPPASPGPVRTRAEQPPLGTAGSQSPGSESPDSASPGSASGSSEPGSADFGSSPTPTPSHPIASAVPPARKPSAPVTPSVPGTSAGAEAVIRAGRILGQVGIRAERPAPPPDRDEHSAMSGGSSSSSDHAASARAGADHSRSKPAPASPHPSSSKHSTGAKPAPSRPAPAEPSPAKPSPAKPSPAKNDGRGDDSGDPEPQQPAEPDEPPAWAARPSCHERGDCGARPARHHRPDFSRHRQCDNSTHRAHWSHHRTIHIDRSSDRSDHRRRSAVTERPQNVRPASVLERSYSNAGFHSRIPEARSPESRVDDNQITNRSYRGNHRLAGQHHADRPTPAQQRDSRVGRHHADLWADRQADHRADHEDNQHADYQGDRRADYQADQHDDQRSRW